MIAKYTVVLEVEVDAPTEEDAFEMIQESYGVGDDFGLKVTSCHYNENNE